jgi:ribosome modulation factor
MSEVHKDLTNGVSADTIIHHHTQFEALNSKKSEIGGKVGQQRKRAVDDGFEMEGYTLGVKLGKKGAEDALKILNFAILTVQACYPAVGAQLKLFQDITPVAQKTQADLEAEWFGKGFTVGISGGSITANTYAATEPAGQKWLAGFREGEAKYKEGLKALAEDSDMGAKIAGTEAAAPSNVIAPKGGFGASGGKDSYKVEADAEKPEPDAPADAAAAKAPSRRGRPPKAAASAPEPAPAATSKKSTKAKDSAPPPPPPAPEPELPPPAASLDDGDDTPPFSEPELPPAMPEPMFA